MRSILKTGRFALYAAAGLVLIAGGFAYYEFHLRLPIGSGPAGPIIDAGLFKKQWSTREVWVVGLGDSVTAGFGARKGYSYFDRLVENPPEEFAGLSGVCLRSVFSDLKVTNLAMSGSTSIQSLKAQFRRLGRHSTNVLGIAVMTTGGNDIIHDYGRRPPCEGAMFGASMAQAQPWIDNFEKRLGVMYEQLTNAFPGGCEIFLADIYDPTDGVGDPERAGLPVWKDGQEILSSYNAILDRFARTHEKVHLVDMHGAFLGHGIHCREFWRRTHDSKDSHYWYHDNLEDPNERGYDALRRLFLLKMAEVFKTPI